MWDKHWTNGGTGITRDCGLIVSDDYRKIAESVHRFGDAAIWMENGDRELHTHHKNLSAFWEFHRKLHSRLP